MTQTQAEYNAVYAKLLALITADEGNEVPVMFRSMIPKEAAPHLADQCTKVAISALDDFRSHQAKVASSQGEVPK